MRQKGLLIDRLKGAGRTTQRRVDVAAAVRHDPVLAAGAVQGIIQLLGVDARVLTQVPLYRQGLEPLLARPVVGRGDRHGIFQGDHIAHARHLPRCAGVNRFELAAVYRTGQGRGHQHARHLQVDGELRLAIYLGRRIQPGRGRAEQTELIRRFEHHRLRQRQCTGGIHQFAVGQLLPGRSVHHRITRLTLGGIYPPARRRGLNQQQPRGCSGLAQRLPGMPCRG